jgi:peroxiredoxin
VLLLHEAEALSGDSTVKEAARPPRDLMEQTMAAENLRVRRDYPRFASAYDTLVARLARSGAGGTAPKTGDILPPFLLPDENGQLVSLQNFGDVKSIVISLNRGHWCTYCRVEFESLESIHDEISRRGGAILAITPDRQPYARALKEQCHLSYPVLSDMDNAYAMSLGLLVWCGDEVRNLYRTIDWNLDIFQGNDGWMVPIPATYVVAPDGRIKACFVDPDFRRRMELAEVLDAVAKD